MSSDAQAQEEEWKKVWDARIAALAPFLGVPTNMVLHATIPFQLGGSADVLMFPNFISGVTYVTAEMTGEDVGQRPNSSGNYELMICAKQELQKAGDLISKLARYTCDAELEAGQTMDLGTFFGDSSIRALLFAHPKEQEIQFSVLGQNCSLLLCVGITSEELAYGRSEGTEKLLSLLKQHDVFPFTIPERSSVPLPRG